MTTPSPINSQGAFADASIYLPDDLQELVLKLTDTLRDDATAINAREIGLYDSVERITGSLMYSSNAQVLRPVFRRTVNFGALPNAAVKSVAHNIAISGNFEFLKILMTATNPAAVGAAPFAIPIPYSTEIVNGDIQLDVSLTNIIVTTAIDYSAFTKSSVILEYVKA